MRYGSVCSGIEAATAAWHPLGWEPAFFSEIEPAPRSVLAHHYPNVPLHGDFTTIGADEYGAIDLLVGGTPCQSFSVAGLRGGMADERGNLALEYLRLADRKRPRWLVWENVPGVLSSNGGRDFGSILRGMAELGYGFAYRILDAQYFGVPQRRRRVFVVGYIGDWRPAAAVLFERHSLSGHPAPRRETGQGIAGAIARCSFSGGSGGRPEGAAAGHFVAGTIGARTCGSIGAQDAYSGHLIPQGCGGEVAPTLNSAFGSKLRLDNQHIDGGGDCLSPPLAMCLNAGAMGRQDAESETLIAVNRCDFDVAQPVAYQTSGNCGAWETGQITGVLDTNTDPNSHAIAFGIDDGIGHCLRSGASKADKPTSTTYVGSPRAVRRLTPRECERLQGFPDATNSVSIHVCKSADEKQEIAQSAKWNTAAQSLAQNAPVAVDVLIDLERSVLQIRSLGKSPLSVQDASDTSWCHLSMPQGDFVRLAALMTQTLAQAIRAGSVGSQQNIRRSSHPLNGSASVLLSGQEIAALASDAGKFTAAVDALTKSTTSQLGFNTRPYGLILETLACCVSAAISGSIPPAMRNACSYEIRIVTAQGYTAVPHRGKPMADGPRYKALGNSMAVPVMRWIGERIALVEAAQC